MLAMDQKSDKPAKQAIETTTKKWSVSD